MRQQYGLNELRSMFLNFMESKGHLKMNSFSLIPHNDNSLLLINSGMAPLKPYFTRQEIPPRYRVTTCQKCIRTGDIENVGKTDRHGTFFEMLGNFSFGDYFKHEAIAWSWEFLTKVVGLEEDRLYPSVYLDDDEAFEIWNKEIGIDPERIFRFGKEDNFWEHGAGPCGPCSEIYYDRGEKYGCGKPGCTVGCECDRYMEIWNNVFTQFNNDGQGNYTTLEHKNIDTGMGLERLASVVQDVDSIFDVDTLVALRDEVCKLSGTTYKKDANTDVSIRLITDHIRSVTFMVSDGIMPSNEGRGYVLRRLLRRAARHGRLLGIKGNFLADLSKKVIEVSKDGYPELVERQEFITHVITQEEEKFAKTIDQGLSMLNDLRDALKADGKTVLAGEDAFRLYDTYGFPMDLTAEILEDDGMTIDEEGFSAAMNEQREKARNARQKSNYMGADATVYLELDTAMTSEFIGYDYLEAEGRILALTTEDEVVDALVDGQKGTIITDKTPFYATSGGQESDKGVITLGDCIFEVNEVIKIGSSGKIGHIGTVKNGMFKVNDTVMLRIDKNRRADGCKNHSATHLLQKALKIVLGDHVQQQGSLNNENYLRFDFSHFSAMTADEIAEVESIVNAQIANALPVLTKVMSIEEAKKTGAMALFSEKYGDNVRVVAMGDFSKELCGGTHVANTSLIGNFKIISESGVAAGVRRIEALTGQGVIDYYADIEKSFNEAAATAKCEPAKLTSRIESMLSEIKELTRENEKLKNQMAKDAMGNVMDQVEEINGIKFLAVKVDNVDMNSLRNLGDQLKEKLGEGVIAIASSADGKVNLITMATEDAIKRGAHAGNLIKGIAKLVGGGGGGRPNMAQAGGKNPDGIDAALAEAKAVLASQIK